MRMMMTLAEREPGRGLGDITWRLLLLNAAGPVFGDVLVFRLGSFPVTIPHVLLAVTTGMVLWRSKRVDLRLAAVFALIVSAEVVHALAFGFAASSEWQRSFAQFAAYGACFVALTKLRPDRDLLAGSAPWAMKLSIAAGGLGILQFILLGAGVPAYLPRPLSAWGLDLSRLTGRYGEFSPAMGLAKEPSYYAIGLATLLAYLFFLRRARAVSHKKLYLLSIIVLLSGIYLSFSLSGILIAGLLLIQQLLSPRNVVWALLALAGLVVLLWVPLPRIGLLEPLRARLQTTAQGTDSSAYIRITSSTRLLFARFGNLETSMLGTGLGMEDREKQTYRDVYDLPAGKRRDRDLVEIHNILTIVRFLQGWLGLALYMALLWFAFKPLAGRSGPMIPVILFFLLYHFAIGLYLSPLFWSLLALVTLLRKAVLSGAQGRRPFESRGASA